MSKKGPVSLRERVKKVLSGDVKTGDEAAAFLKNVAQKMEKQQKSAKKDIAEAKKSLGSKKSGASPAQVKKTKKALDKATKALDKAIEEEEEAFPSGWGLNDSPPAEKKAQSAIRERLEARTQALKDLATEEAILAAEVAAAQTIAEGKQASPLTALERREAREREKKNQPPKIQRPRKRIQIVDEEELERLATEAAEEEEEEEEEEEKEEEEEEDEEATETDEEKIPLSAYAKKILEAKKAAAPETKPTKPKKPREPKVKFKNIVEDQEVLMPPSRVKHLVQVATKIKGIKVGRGFAAQLNDRANEFAQMVAKNLFFLNADCKVKTISEDMLKKALQIAASSKKASGFEAYKKKYLKGVSKKEISKLMPFGARLRAIVINAATKGGHGFTRMSKGAVTMLQEHLFVRIIQTILRIQEYLKDKGRSEKIFTACPPLVMRAEMEDMDAASLLLADTKTMSGDDDDEEATSALLGDSPDMASDEDDSEAENALFVADSPSMDGEDDDEWAEEFDAFMSTMDWQNEQDGGYIDSEDGSDDYEGEPDYQGACPDMGENELLPPGAESSSSEDDSDSESETEAEI